MQNAFKDIPVVTELNNGKKLFSGTEKQQEPNPLLIISVLQPSPKTTFSLQLNDNWEKNLQELDYLTLVEIILKRHLTKH